MSELEGNIVDIVLYIAATKLIAVRIKEIKNNDD